MAWLGEGLSSLRGQITSFTKEVLSEGREEDHDHEKKFHEAEARIQQLESLCSAKDVEISRLNETNTSLEIIVNKLMFENQKQPQQSSLFNVGSTSSLGEFPRVYSLEDLGYGKKENTYDFSSMETEKDDLVDYLRAEIRALKIEKEKVEKKLQAFQNECRSSEENLQSSKSDVVKSESKKSENPSSKTQYAGNTSMETDLPLQDLEQSSAMEVDSAEFGDVTDKSSQSTVNNKELQKAQLIRVQQDMVNRIIQRSEKAYEGDLALKKYDVEKGHASPFVEIIRSLNDPNQQNFSDQEHLSNSENISEEIKFLTDVDSTEKKWRIEDARGECDGSEEMPKEVIKLMDQISKLTSSLSDAQLSVNQFQEREKQLIYEIERMKDQELRAEDTIKNLKMQLDATQETNTQLEQKLEDLDSQHLQAIDELMSVKSSLQQRNEGLQSEIKDMDEKILGLENQISEYSSNANMFSVNESSLRREIELEMEKQILKFIPPELIPREGNSNGEFSVMVGAVKGLAKLCEENRWKKETVEKKMAEIVKEAREVESQYLQLRADIAHRENSSGLRTEGLEPIMETGEEEEEDEDIPDAVPRISAQNDSIRAAMETKLAVSNGDNINLQKRCLALEEEIKKLRAREVMEPDLFDEEDEDDADGIEEANDWTWQANLEPKKTDISSDSGSSNEIAPHANYVEESGASQTDMGLSLSVKHDTPKLNEQYRTDKLKLEKIIEELQEEKQNLVVEREAAYVTIEKMKDEMDDLKVILETRDNQIADLVNSIKPLEEKISIFETEKEFLEQQIILKDDKIKELGSNITSIGAEFENETRKNDEMRRTIFDLNRQIAHHEFILKDQEELLHKHKENEKLLEDENISLQQSKKQEEDLKTENSRYISELEDVIKEIKTELAKEIVLKDDALREAHTAIERYHDLDIKLNTEIQGKEKALSKLSEVEGRFRLLEESIGSEMMSRNEFTDKVTELENRLLLIQEEAALDKKLKDEAILRASEQEGMVTNIENELSVARVRLQEREKALQEYQHKLEALEMERERIMCVVGDKAREISSLRSERQRLMEAMSSMEKSRQREVVDGEHALLMNLSNEALKHKDGPDQTETPPGEREELDDDGTIQLLAKLKSLQLESEQLAESYRQEQQRNKHLQNEVHEMMEKEASLQDELNRLRQHLVSVEDRYTKEALSAQERISFLKNKLTQVEERLHASSSAYTSASVRCNQQVESLENQVRALTEKRDESKNRLLAAEEQLAQQAKDLANLQSVLEQFQRDKEREISIVKDKLRMEIASLENKCKELNEEITNLKDQLQQAKEGLSAASRLSEQVDKKSEVITSLKAELKKLTSNLKSAEEKLNTASLNVEGKVEKNLVKNLIIGYLSAPAQGSRRSEVLRIIATILEFSQEEKERIDFVDGSGKGMGWLRGIGGWGGQHKDGAHGSDPNQPSLSEAFIRFLESESRPKSQIRMLSDSRVESNRSSPTSVQSSASTSSAPPLLMSESILPTLPTFSVASGSNSSCILKDVLKDS